MSFFNLSTGNKIAPTATADMGGGDIEPIPDNTMVRAIITEAKWDNPPNGDPIIKLRWDVVDGDYKKRVIFQKIKVEETDAKKRDKALTMLAAIDFNAGGKLVALDRKPTDSDLMMNLTNKPMVLRVRVWEMDDKKGNWVQMVASMSGAVAASGAVAQKAAPAPEKMEGDIDF
jgi:hypothetical protein